MSLTVVTASIDPRRTRPFWESWRRTAEEKYRGVMVVNSAEIDVAEMDCPPLFEDFEVSQLCGVKGVVPAFEWGVKEAAVAEDVGVICCFHDDLLIEEEGWDQRVLGHFLSNPKCGLAAFSGAEGLGSQDIYQVPYAPQQLARQGFFSNMREAEKHGRRELQARRSACGDGFSIIGRPVFLLAAFNYLSSLGVIHHAYDSWMGALAKRWGWETWFLPIKCHHAGGMTAVGSAEYQRWAEAKGGDEALWNDSHLKMWEDCRDVLPFRVA